MVVQVRAAGRRILGRVTPSSSSVPCSAKRFVRSAAVFTVGRANDDDRAAGARLWDPTRTWTPADVDHYVEMFDNDASMVPRGRVLPSRVALPSTARRRDVRVLVEPKVAGVVGAQRVRAHGVRARGLAQDLSASGAVALQPVPHPTSVRLGHTGGRLSTRRRPLRRIVPRHFPDLHVRGARCGHFVPEEDPHAPTKYSPTSSPPASEAPALLIPRSRSQTWVYIPRLTAELGRACPNQSGRAGSGGRRRWSDCDRQDVSEGPNGRLGHRVSEDPTCPRSPHRSHCGHL